MKSCFSYPYKILPPAFLGSLAAFLVSFGIAYLQDAARVAELERLAWLHLSYAEELKDDMAVIDWSKNLEKLDSVKAFRVDLDSKPVAQGGNANYLPPTIPEGVAYLFPSLWSCRMLSTKAQPFSMEFTLVLQTWPGPFGWGLFAFLGCFAGTCALGLFFAFTPTGIVRPIPVSDQNGIQSNGPRPSSPEAGLKLPKDQPAQDSPYLFIDKNYIIRQVSLKAAGFFQKKPEDLLNGHLLDLAPDTGLIQAFEKADEAKILNPFPNYPGVVAQLKPDSNGCLLVLESLPGPKPL